MSHFHFQSSSQHTVPETPTSRHAHSITPNSGWYGRGVVVGGGSSDQGSPFQSDTPVGPFHLTPTAIVFACSRVFLFVFVFGCWNPRWAMERDTRNTLTMTALVLGKHLALSK